MKCGPQAKTSSKSILAAQRRAEILRLRIDGHTLEEIGKHMGIRADTVHGIITRALSSITHEPAEELLALELARCNELLDEAMDTVHAFHPLVHAGSVVRAVLTNENGEAQRDPATGELLTHVLEDKAPKLAAINTALRVMERRAKLLGLDKATKIAATDAAGNAVPVVHFYLPENNR